MYFPKISEIVTKDVITVDCNTSIKETIRILKESSHRSLIVLHENDYHLFSASDLLKIKLHKENLDTKLVDIPLKTVPQVHKDVSILDTMELVNSGAEYICVVNEDRSLYGLVTNSDIVSSIDPETLMENFTVKDYFQKTNKINFIESDQTIQDAMQIMDSYNSDCVIITKDQKPAGIMTIKDTISIVSSNIDINHKIENFYSSPIQTVPENFTIKESVEFINDKHFKRIIAANKNGEIIGIITQQELIAHSYNHWASMMKNYHDELLKLNRELQEKSNNLQKMATTDMLTKLYNRHMFSELFNKFLEKSRREKDEGKLALAILDIDDFKVINDSYGHNVGDDVLVDIASLISSTLRSSDIIGRWGGEEFVVLLTNTNIKNGFDTIENLRNIISKYNFKLVKKLTVSIGITIVKGDDTLETAIKKADDALYISKESGKNRVAKS